MNILEQRSIGFRPAAFLSGSPDPWASHLPFAADFIAALRPAVLVELGVSYGDSYFGFCQAGAEAGVACACYGIDAFGDGAVREAAHRHNDRFYRSFSRLLRSGFDEALEQFSNENIGLLHVNAFRGYEDARCTFDTWLPKVRPGGVILMHGITIHGIGNGLGVLRKNGASADSAYLDELFSSSAENQERIRRYYTLCAERIELEHYTGSAPTGSAEAIQVLEQRLDHADERIERQRKASLASIKDQERTQGARKATSRAIALLEQEKVFRAAMEYSPSWQLTKQLRAVLALFHPFGGFV